MRLDEVFMSETHSEAAMKSDEELVREFKAGSHQAFAMLVRKYQDAVLGLAYRYVGDYDEAVDIAQETFVRLFRHSDSILPATRIAKYLFTITANLARTELRRFWRRETISLDDGDILEDETYWRNFVETEYTPDVRVDRSEVAQRIQKALMTLPPLLRETVILRDIKECSYEDIAEITDTEIGTVRSRINRARKQLREVLADFYHENLQD